MDAYRDNSLILASRSPRRTALLQMIGVPHVVRDPVGTEVLPYKESEVIDEWRAIEICRQLAAEKARGVAALYPGREVLGADTIVVTDGRVFGKPVDEAEAKRMLTLLTGRTHRVYTGICLIEGSRMLTDVVSTEVTFFPASKEMSQLIERYAASGAPLDKAGAYGIQDFGALLIEGIRGDYYNVVGLPLAAFWRLRQSLKTGNKEKTDEKNN